MKSMTGFASAQGKDSKTCVDVSIRAVNGRYLEARFHLPRLYSHLEMDFKKRVAKTVERGTLEISVRRSSETIPDIQFNQHLAEAWLTGMQKIAKTLRLQPLQEASALLHLPDFYQVREAQEISKAEHKLVQRTLDEALEKLEVAREREGAQLGKGILSHLRQIQSEVVAIEKLRTQALPEMRQRFTERLREVLAADADGQKRIEQELAFLLERGDIAEEILRLRSHLHTLQSLVASKTIQGKKLDFYAQELLREINTIGAKSQQADLTRHVIEAKAAIEKYREQVQNIE